MVRYHTYMVKPFLLLMGVFTFVAAQGQQILPPQQKGLATLLQESKLPQFWRPAHKPQQQPQVPVTVIPASPRSVGSQISPQPELASVSLSSTSSESLSDNSDDDGMGVGPCPFQEILPQQVIPKRVKPITPQTKEQEIKRVIVFVAKHPKQKKILFNGLGNTKNKQKLDDLLRAAQAVRAQSTGKEFTLCDQLITYLVLKKNPVTFVAQQLQQGLSPEFLNRLKERKRPDLRKRLLAQLKNWTVRAAIAAVDMPDRIGVGRAGDRLLEHWQEANDRLDQLGLGADDVVKKLTTSKEKTAKGYWERFKKYIQQKFDDLELVPHIE